MPTYCVHGGRGDQTPEIITVPKITFMSQECLLNI